ncbi:MAG: hypothetical protein IPM64_16605 [Phycisphaerales bacterium]|nr:hypothetical protein [Phycisphaerales bacterium]
MRRARRGRASGPAGQRRGTVRSDTRRPGSTARARSGAATARKRGKVRRKSGVGAGRIRADAPLLGWAAPAALVIGTLAALLLARLISWAAG